MAPTHAPTDHPSTQTVLATLAHLGCATLSQLHALCFPQAFASTVRLALIGLAEAGLITHSHWRLTQGERCQVWTITTKGLAQVRRDLPHLAHVHAPDLNRPSTTREKDEWRVRIEVRSWIVRLILEARQQLVCASAALSTSMLYPVPLSPDGPPQPDASIALAWESATVQAPDWLPWASAPTNEATRARYRVYVERIGHPTALERWVGHCATAAQDSTPLLILATPERYHDVANVFPQEHQTSPIRLCSRTEIGSDLLRAPWRDIDGQRCSLRPNTVERLT